MCAIFQAVDDNAAVREEESKTVREGVSAMAALKNDA